MRPHGPGGGRLPDRGYGHRRRDSGAQGRALQGDSGYLAVAAGDYFVTVTASGDKAPVIGLPVTLADGQVLTAAALSDSVGAWILRC